MRALAPILLALLLAGCGDPPPAEGDSPVATAGRKATPEMMKGRSMAERQGGKGR